MKPKALTPINEENSPEQVRISNTNSNTVLGDDLDRYAKKMDITRISGLQLTVKQL